METPQDVTDFNIDLVLSSDEELDDYAEILERIIEASSFDALTRHSLLNTPLTLQEMTTETKVKVLADESSLNTSFIPRKTLRDMTTEQPKALADEPSLNTSCMPRKTLRDMTTETKVKVLADESSLNTSLIPRKTLRDMTTETEVKALADEPSLNTSFIPRKTLRDMTTETKEDALADETTEKSLADEVGEKTKPMVVKKSAKAKQKSMTRPLAEETETKRSKTKRSKTECVDETKRNRRWAKELAKRQKAREEQQKMTNDISDLRDKYNKLLQATKKPDSSKGKKLTLNEKYDVLTLKIDLILNELKELRNEQ